MAVVITGILQESYILFRAMSSYLLFGFLFAGILHVFIPTDAVTRHLGKNSFFSVIKASLFGIPLPLCSCSVIPAAMSLRKQKASTGSVLSFLISTPATGVDSIFATYSLLGGLFTVFRVIASFIAGVVAGIAANVFIKEDTHAPRKSIPKCKSCHGEEHAHGTLHKIKGVFTYAFGDLLRDTGMPLILGIVVGGVITFFVPENFIQTYLGNDMKAMLVMLIVGIPMYVCATASIPIAMALVMKGINPGAAFVFLLAGPATNIVTMTVVAKSMGVRALVVYLSSIACSSIALGVFLDKIYVYYYQGDHISSILQRQTIIPGSISTVSAVVLLVLIVYNLYRNKAC